MQKYAESFYNSKTWHSCRTAYAQSKRGLCERCLKKGIVKAGEAVHHITPITPENINDPNITLSWDNLMLVCRDCHGELHRRPRRYKVDELGRIIT